MRGEEGVNWCIVWRGGGGTGSEKGAHRSVLERRRRVKIGVLCLLPFSSCGAGFALSLEGYRPPLCARCMGVSCVRSRGRNVREGKGAQCVGEKGHYVY